MSKIQQLNEHLTNMIAAGEVVERPSGIIKELVENSIDAQSSKIRIETTNGGLDSILVMDNGEGIEKDDLEKAFERHSTSKIKEVSDLSSISSLGFRGEALPSIASVSLVEAISHQQRLIIDNGQKKGIEPYQSNEGLTISVKELFFKTPARLKYLKSPSYEATRNLALIHQFALGYPHISFELVSDQRQVFLSSGKNNLQEVIFQVYGYDIAKMFKLFEDENYDFKISGGYVLPHVHRANKYNIFLYLNHRMIRYYNVSQKIIEIFQHYMPIDRYPIVVLNIESDTHLVDVNVHPSKWEIRLAKEAILIELIEKVLIQSLESEMGVKKVSSTLFEKPQVISFYDLEVNEPQTPTFEPSKSIQNAHETSTYIEPEPEPEPEVELVSVFQEKIEVIGQHHGNYILAQDSQSLYIFDQHASMERIQYERILNQLQTKTFDSQLLLFPLSFENQGFLVEKLDEVNTYLSNYGLGFESLSQDTLILRSIPSWMDDQQADNIVMSILDLLNEEKKVSFRSLSQKKIATMACHRSVRFNEALSPLQCQKIVDDLMDCHQPYHCPHGRPTFVKVESARLMKEFSR